MGERLLYRLGMGIAIAGAAWVLWVSPVSVPVKVAFAGLLVAFFAAVEGGINR